MDDDAMNCIMKVTRFSDKYVLWDGNKGLPVFVGTEAEILELPDVNKVRVDRAKITGSDSYTATGWWNGPVLLIDNRYVLERNRLKDLLKALEVNRLDSFVQGLYDMESDREKEEDIWPQGESSED